MAYSQITGGRLVFETGHQGTAQYVWDTTNLVWAAMTQPGTSGGGGGGSNAAAGTTGAAVPTSADYSGWNSGGNLVGTSLTNALPVQPGTGSTFPVSGTFWQATQPVSLASMPTTPVTGTFWQTTQPVSLASLPALATGANAIGSITNTSFASTQSGTWTVATNADATIAAGTAPSKALVIGGVYNSTPPGLTNGQTVAVQVDANGNQKVNIANTAVAVTGTFWQATQPVSIASMPTTAVTGTFWQTTQPVSLASTTVTGSVSVIQVTASNLNATVTPIAITKGTQGATGFTTQALVDAGRNVSNFFMVLPVVTTATDTLQSLTGYKSNAAVTATTTPAVVTTGKTYRITSIQLAYVAIATAGYAKFTLRANTGGVVAIGSAAVQNWFLGGPGVTAGMFFSETIDFPDGLEFAAGTGIGVSVIGYGATGTAAAVGYAAISIYGFEY